MTAAPIIVSGTTGSGTRFVQFWGEEKVAGRVAQMCAAEMNLGAEFAPRLLMIAQQCPAEWVPVVLEVFERFRAGEVVEGTHTVAWEFGKPTFEAVPA